MAQHGRAWPPPGVLRGPGHVATGVVVRAGCNVAAVHEIGPWQCAVLMV